MAKAEQPYLPNWEVIKAVGLRIKHIRNKKRLSIYQLSEKSGLSYVTISRIENGHKNLTVSTLYDFAKGLDIPVHKLVV